MDKRTKRNLLLFFRRFRRNYEFFLQSYKGKTPSLYLDQFKRDNIKLAQVLFGDEGVKHFTHFIKRTELNT
ncbi:MAG: hypothetical protein ACK40G_07530 [Cytophagaceae bacterium]